MIVSRIKDVTETDVVDNLRSTIGKFEAKTPRSLESAVIQYKILRVFQATDCTKELIQEDRRCTIEWRIHK